MKTQEQIQSDIAAQIRRAERKRGPGPWEVRSPEPRVYTRFKKFEDAREYRRVIGGEMKEVGK